MANELATGVDEATVRLREELAAERAGRETAERFAFAPRPGPIIQGPPPEDPFDKFANDSMKLSPDETKQALDRGVRGRIREEVGPALSNIERRIGYAIQGQAFDQAMDNMLAGNPDMAEAPGQVAAAAAAVEYDLRARRQNAPPGQYARLVQGKFREMFKKDSISAPPPAHIEGVTPPVSAQALKPQPPPEEPKENQFDQWYGEDSGGQWYDASAPEKLQKMTDAYAADRVDWLDSKGGRSFIPRVVQPMRKRAKDKAKAAAAAK